LNFLEQHVKNLADNTPSNPVLWEDRVDTVVSIPTQGYGPLTLERYQAHTEETCIYPHGLDPLYAVLGLVSEAGEVAGLFKKLIRDEGWVPGTPLPEKADKALRKEVGDTLFYLARVAEDCGLSLEEIAHENLANLADRKARGKLGGSGDER